MAGAIDWEMEMLRNKGFRQFIIAFGLIAMMTIRLGFIIHIAAGILAIFSATTFGILFWIFTKARYKRLAEMSEQIDRVLHNEAYLCIDEVEEGELSILQSEITKMTLRIREQNEALKREKEHLADSLTDIAHQLRTPLTSINLILSLLENTADENESKILIREMEELLTQMDWLLTALLKVSRLDAGIVVFKDVPIDVSHLIHTAIRPFLIQMELHDIIFQIDIPKELMIKGDFEWLTQAIQNLLKNCIESIGDNGKIKICCTDNPLFTEMTIHDSGKGFKEEDLPCLFNRFYSGKNVRKAGYGIGLALCKMIITRQGGTITAKNHPQGGAVFFIRFLK